MSLELGLIFYHRPYNWGPNSVFPAIFGNQRCLIGVIDTGCICGVMRLPPGDYCNGWLGMGDDKILGGGSIQMGLHGDNFLRHGACLVLSSPLDMGGFWHSAAAHPRQNLVQYPPPGLQDHVFSTVQQSRFRYKLVMFNGYTGVYERWVSCGAGSSTLESWPRPFYCLPKRGCGSELVDPKRCMNQNDLVCA